MVYRFVIASNEVKDFRRDILIDGSDTFLALHQALQRTLGYTGSEPALFRLTNRQWKPERDIHLVDMGFGRSDEEVYLMEDTYLEDFLEEKGARLLYTFDMLGNRSLYMELREVKLGESLDEPEVVQESGVAPVQTSSIDELIEPTQPVKQSQKKAPEDVDLIKEMGYESDDYSEDELSDLDISEEEL